MSSLSLRCLLCWCGAFLSPNSNRKKSSSADDDNDDYYVIVGVDRHASEAEIRKAYKVRSRQLHPDKVAQREGRVANDADKAAFQRMKAAYDVIVDPSQRELYDELGVNGLKMLNDPTSLSPEEMMKNFAESSVFARTRLFLGISIVVLLLLFVPILACLRADNVISSSWISIMTPLWIYNIFTSFALITMVMGARSYLRTLRERQAKQEEEKDDDESDVPEVDDEMIDVAKAMVIDRWIKLFQFAAIFWFEVVLFQKLDSDNDSEWSIIFTPLFIWLGLGILYSVPFAFGPITINKNDDVMNYVMKLQQKMDSKRTIFRNVIFIVFIILVTIKLDYNEDNSRDIPSFFESWWAVFTPVWFILGISFCYSCCCGDTANFSDELDEAENSTDEHTSANLKVPVERTTDDSDDKNELLHDNSNVVPLTNTKSSDNETSMSHAPASATLPEVRDNAVEKGDTGSGGVSDLPHPEEAKTESEVEDDKANVYLQQSSANNSPGICLQILVIATTLIFCAKLQHDEDSSDDDSFSSFWIAFPLLFFPAGLFLCFMGCSIYAVKESDIEDFNENHHASDVPNPTDDLAEKGMMSVTTEPLQPVSDPAHPAPKTSENNQPDYGDELD